MRLDLARRGPWATALGLAAVAACSRCGSAPPAVGRFEGGSVTREELEREQARMPPALRGQFSSAAGQRELVSALVDKKLLALEARRQGLHQEPEVRRQVGELEDKLAIQALVAAAEKSAPPPTAEEVEAWYRSHLAELVQPERARVGRILVAVAADATAAERAKARQRVEGLARRVARGEPFEKVAAAGDGAERARGGELGLLVKGAVQDAELGRAVFALAPGATSPVTPVAEGFAVLRLLELRPSRTPPLEEARGEVLNRLTPLRHRKAFDDLLARLRAEARPRIELAQEGK